MHPLLSVVDLFCGAGGLSFGFRAAGFNLVWAADSSEAAARTYGTNLGEHVVCQSIDDDTEPPEATVIAGGPPCQGFSSAGMRRAGDQRNTLVACFAQIVARKRPRAFVFENVEGFLTAEGGKRVLDLLTPLVTAGYRIHVRKVNAANYGVPQHRKRVIAIGGLGWEPSFPEPTHSAYGAPGARLAGGRLPPTPTLQEALAGLPVPSTTEPGNPHGHFYRPLVGIDLERARALKPGQTILIFSQKMSGSRRLGKMGKKGRKVGNRIHEARYILHRSGNGFMIEWHFLTRVRIQRGNPSERGSYSVAIGHSQLARTTATTPCQPAASHLAAQAELSRRDSRIASNLRRC